MSQVSSKPSETDGQLLIDQMTSCDPWISSTEGPYTRLGKFAILNALKPKDLCQIVFGRKLRGDNPSIFHGRSLLINDWMVSDNSINPLAKQISTSTLEHLCGHWTKWISSDVHMRFCPVCLDRGYQSSIFQIAAMSVCPIHEVRLMYNCPYCNAPTPRYALMQSAFYDALHCYACKKPYGKAWDRSHYITDWLPPEDEAPFIEMNQWLKRIGNSDIVWPEIKAWLAEGDEMRCSHKKELSIFSVISSIITPPKSSLIRLSPIHIYFNSNISNPTKRTTASNQNPHQSKVSIYKSIRRHFWRTMGMHPKYVNKQTNKSFVGEYRTGAVFPDTNEVSSDEHAIFIWRIRFEKDGDKILPTRLISNQPKFVPKLELTEWIFQNPWNFDDSTWGNFLYLCLLEDKWATKQWLIEVSDLFKHHECKNYYSKVDDENHMHLKFFEICDRWVHCLTPKQGYWNDPITMLHLKSERLTSCGVILASVDRD